MAGPGAMVKAGRKAVFLDRDGVLNRSLVVEGKPYAPRRLEDFEILPEVPAAVEALKAGGFALVVVTNQPDIGNGLVAPEVVAAMHRLLQAELPVDAIELCPHAQNAGCACRKPAPGMLLRAADRLGLDLDSSYMIGDRKSDVVAGRKAGCYSIFLDRGYTESVDVPADSSARDLAEAAQIVLTRDATLGRQDGRKGVHFHD